jgi:hypothetical protein
MFGAVVLQKLFGLRGRKQQGAGEKYIMRNIFIFTPRQTLLDFPNEEG